MAASCADVLPTIPPVAMSFSPGQHTQILRQLLSAPMWACSELATKWLRARSLCSYSS